MEMVTLQLSQFARRGAYYHIARHHITAASPSSLHDHAFAEVFWVERGRIRHHIDDQVQMLGPGEVVLIRPADAHSLHTSGGQEACIVNVAFATEHLDFLRKRYFARQHWPWQGDVLPTTRSLSATQLARLQEQVPLLASGPATRLALERFLLTLLGELGEESHATTLPPLPAWLQRAVEHLRQHPASLALGVSELARIAGRSREHVARVLKRAAGERPVDLINRLRLERASMELRLTDKPIAAIAIDCGLGNLSHFYKCFSQRFGTTPRRYRLQAQIPLRGEQS